MAVRFVVRAKDAQGITHYVCPDVPHADYYLCATEPELEVRLRDRVEAMAFRGFIAHSFPDFKFEVVMLQGSLRLAKLPERFQWTLHNLVAHPVSEVLFQLGLNRLSDLIHDRTIPLHEAGEGRG